MTADLRREADALIAGDEFDREATVQLLVQAADELDGKETMLAIERERIKQLRRALNSSETARLFPPPVSPDNADKNPELRRALAGDGKALAALERLEIALLDTLDDDEATSAAQIAVREGWRPATEFDRVVQDAYDRVVRERDFFKDDRDLLVLHNESLANHNERLESLCKPVVERYGRVWAKDTEYYAAAEALGIKEPPDPCEQAGRHVCGVVDSDLILGRCSHGVDLDHDICPEGCRV